MNTKSVFVAMVLAFSTGALIAAAGCGKKSETSHHNHDHQEGTQKPTVEQSPAAKEVMVELETKPPTTQPEPVEVKTIPAPIDPPKNLGWRSVSPDEFGELKGHWGTSFKRVKPRILIEVDRPGSKTPFNVKFDNSPELHGGCGFYESGAAYCKVLDDKDHKKEAKTVVTSIYFQTKDLNQLKVQIDKVGEFLLVRAN